MNTRKIKFTSILLATLFLAVIVWFAPVVASAQILKPGEIIYSRAATVQGGNCDTASIWVVGQDGSNDRFITQGLHPRISPDGRFLLFKRFNPNSLCSPFGIAPTWWSRELATNRETQIAFNFQPSSGHFFSPETNRGIHQIVKSDGAGLCRMNTDGTNRFCSFIPQLDPIRGSGHPSVRGTDNLLLVQNFLDNADGGLYTLNYDDFQNRQKIPNTIGRDLLPSWSNDGQRIAFAAFPTGRGEPYFFTNLLKIDANGSNRTQLTSFTQQFGEGFSYSLIWTKDNLTIINAAKLNGIAGIYKIATDGSGTISQISITAGAVPELVGGIVPVYSEQQVASFGGGSATGNNYTLVDNAGQAFAGQTSTSGNFSFASGFWTLATSAVGLEGDVASRPNGDGSILANDVILVRHFINGTSTPDSATNEFQRADSAPRSTSGDGVIGSNVIIQTRRYQNGIDPLQNAGGPTEGNFAAGAAEPSEEANAENPRGAVRAVRVQSANADAGQPVTVNIRVDAFGDEAGYGFRLNYNNFRLLNPVIGAGNAGALVRSCTPTTAGLNCAVDTFPNNSPTSSEPSTGEIALGNDQILMTVTFTIAPTAPNGALPVTLTTVNASNDNADSLAITSVNGTVSVGAPTAAAVSVAGRVFSDVGRGLAKAQVTLTDAGGQSRRILTNSFGYFRFDEVVTGETYIFEVTHKRYRFTPQAVNVADEVTGLDFIAEP